LGFVTLCCGSGQEGARPGFCVSFTRAPLFFFLPATFSGALKFLAVLSAQSRFPSPLAIFFFFLRGLLSRIHCHMLEAFFSAFCRTFFFSFLVLPVFLLFFFFPQGWQGCPPRFRAPWGHIFMIIFLFVRSLCRLFPLFGIVLFFCYVGDLPPFLKRARM